MVIYKKLKTYDLYIVDEEEVPKILQQIIVFFLLNKLLNI